MMAPFPFILSPPAGRGSCHSQRWQGEKGANEGKPRGAPGHRWVLPAPGQEQAGPRDAGRTWGRRQDAGTQAGRRDTGSRVTLSPPPVPVFYTCF